jgi:hypothetical protein
MLLKLRNRIQEYSKEYEVGFRMLQNHAFELVKFWSCWDYDTCRQDYAGAPGARLSGIENIKCLYRIVQFDKLSPSFIPESGVPIKLIYSPVGI